MTNFPFAKGSVMDEQFPRRLRLRGLLPQRRQHLGRRPHRAVPGRPRTPASTPRSWRSRASPGSRSTTGRWSTSQGFKDLVDAVGGVTLNVRAADPGRRPRRRRHRLHPARRAQARRPRHALVRPGPRRLRRLLADGAAEVRDERDAPPDQPADRRSRNFEKIAKAQLRDDLHRHPGQRGRPLHVSSRSRPRARRSPRSRSCRR